MKSLCFFVFLFVALCSNVFASENLPKSNIADEMMAIATLINMHGKPCTKVISVRRLATDQKVLEVKCFEPRGGDKAIDYGVEINYIVDTNTGLVKEK